MKIGIFYAKITCVEEMYIKIIEPVPSIRLNLACAYSEDSNQSAHLHSLIRVLDFLWMKK